MDIAYIPLIFYLRKVEEYINIYIDIMVRTSSAFRRLSTGRLRKKAIVMIC